MDFLSPKRCPFMVSKIDREWCTIRRMQSFNKLVRDKIPEIIEANGDVPQYHIIECDDEYLQELLKKDVEEGRELAEDTNLEELADKLEVIYAIAKAKGFTPEQVEATRLTKLEARGGFDKRIFLESTK